MELGKEISADVKKDIKKIINFTAFTYAAQNTKKNDIIELLKEYNLELNANQTLVVDDFFARREYKRCLPLYLNQEKHTLLKRTSPQSKTRRAGGHHRGVAGEPRALLVCLPKRCRADYDPIQTPRPYQPDRV